VEAATRNAAGGTLATTTSPDAVIIRSIRVPSPHCRSTRSVVALAALRVMLQTATPQRYFDQ
jgi:hypothetical protein